MSAYNFDVSLPWMCSGCELVRIARDLEDELRSYIDVEDNDLPITSAETIKLKIWIKTVLDDEETLEDESLTELKYTEEDILRLRREFDATSFLCMKKLQCWRTLREHESSVNLNLRLSDDSSVSDDDQWHASLDDTHIETITNAMVLVRDSVDNFKLIIQSKKEIEYKDLADVASKWNAEYRPIVSHVSHYNDAIEALAAANTLLEQSKEELAHAKRERLSCVLDPVQMEWNKITNKEHDAKSMDALSSMVADLMDAVEDIAQDM